MARKKKGQLYIGVILISIGIIILTYVLTTGPYDNIPQTTTTVIYDSPTKLPLNDVEAGDKLILNFESTKPVNVIILRARDFGDYFLLEDNSVEHIILASESTAGSFEYTFNRSGNWCVCFEDPNPPPPYEKPKVTYWGEFIEDNKDLSMHYTNITTGIVLIVLGLVFIYSYGRKKVAIDKGENLKKSEKGREHKMDKKSKKSKGYR